MLLQLAVRSDGLLRRLFRLPRGFLQGLDSLVDLFQALRAIVELGDAPGQIVEPRRDRGRLFGDLLERFAERRELRAPGRQRGQHRADGAALFAGGRDEAIEVLALFLNELALVAREGFEGV